ncbi:MAG: alpha/beta fold hydrolase [Betaproteobacteria bacterium]|nr:alpha/beta fold hydrolase [Betaproteobacteria bacterium]
MKANANGTEIYYEVHGKEGAPWIVMSHSLACSVRMWDEQIAAFKDKYRILAFDTRGHGSSAAPAGAYSLEMLADDAKGVMDKEGVKRCHWVGLSMGGMIGQTFALKYPGVFQSLTLADTTSSYPAAAAPVWADRIKTAQTQGMEPLVESTLARWFTEPYRKQATKRLADIATLIRNTPVNGYAGCCHAIPKINLTARLKEIKCPILVIVGDQDMGTPPAMAQEIHDNAPGSKLVILPNASHISNIEQSAGFNKALGELLSSS